MSEIMASLLHRRKTIGNIRRAAAVLDWDQQTYLPEGSAEARGEQLATLTAVAHDIETHADMARLLDQAEQENQHEPDDSDVKRMLANARYDYDRAVKIPTSLQEEIIRHSSVAMDAWMSARRENNFPLFAPFLKTTFELERQVAELLGYADEPYDALLDGFERGSKASDIAMMFESLRPELVKLVSSISGSPAQSLDSPMTGPFSVDQQNSFTLQTAEALGYDLKHGRQDIAAHPFCTSFSKWDVRITNRYSKDLITVGLYGALHEAGHAMYEQGMPSRHDNTWLDGAASNGIHESQSRLWENLVGRSRAFAEWIVPRFRDAFPDVTQDVTPEVFYRSVNRVRPSLIRVEADEVTYNLHILLRFELERELVNGGIETDELPDLWRSKMKEYLGIVPETDTLGLLQDIHWSGGMVGYFPSYTLGNLYAAQLWTGILRAIPNVEGQISKGEFAPLLSWLRENIHDQGRKYTAEELIRKSTGEAPSASHLVTYLNNKYQDIYGQ